MKYKVGDKVVILSKYGEKDVENHSVVCRIILKKNQPYGYITDIRKDKYLINDNPGILTGDYFLEEDLRPYLLEERKQKLLKINRTL